MPEVLFSTLHTLSSVLYHLELWYGLLFNGNDIININNKLKIPEFNTQSYNLFVIRFLHDSIIKCCINVLPYNTRLCSGIVLRSLLVKQALIMDHYIASGNICIIHTHENKDIPRYDNILILTTSVFSPRVIFLHQIAITQIPPAIGKWDMIRR